MEGLPARCTKCGHTFLTRAISVGSGTLSVSGNKISCPQPGCGGWADIGSGLFLAKAGDITLQHGPPLTHEMIRKLKEIAENAKTRFDKGSIGAEQILSEIADVSPELSKKLRANHSFGVFALILLLLWVVKSVELNVDIDLNHLIDQAYHLSQKEDPELHWDALPSGWTEEAPSKEAEFPPTTLAGLQAKRPTRRARRRERGGKRRQK